MTALHHDNPANLGDLRQSLLRRLDGFARRVRARLMLEATARWLAVVVGVALLTFALDRLLRLSLVSRRAMFVAFVLIALIEAWRRLAAPLRMKLRPHVLAAALERKTGAPVAARVATVLELAESHDRTSRAMAERAVLRSHESLAGVDFESHLDHRRHRRAAGAIVGMLMLALALVVIFPSSARLWAARLFAGSNEPWPQRTYLDVAGATGGAMTVPRGEPFALRVSARAGSVVPETVSIRWHQGRAARVSISLTKFGDNDFRYDFPALQSDATVEIRGGDDAPAPFTIRPVDRPKIVDLKLVTRHPTEPQPTAHGFSASEQSTGAGGDLSFLPLTEMELQFTANTTIAEAHVRTSTTQPAASDLRRIDERRFAIAWTQSSPAQIQIELTGAEAALTSVPTSVSIGLKTDKPPRATLGFTGVRQRVTPQATIPLVAEARDDYGVARVDLQLKSERADPDDPKKVQTSATTQPVYDTVATTQPDAPRETDVRQPHTLPVPSLKLEPGHLLTLSAVATDACYTGALRAASRTVTFRVVRPEELFREILLRQQGERAKFRKQIDAARKLQDALAAAPSDAPPAPLSREHRTIQREVDRIASSLSSSLTEMKLNVLGTPEAHALMEKNVLERFAALERDLMAPQRDALDALRPDDPATRAAAAARQELIVAAMNEILRQMSQWDSFVDVLNQLNEVIRVQTRVQEGTKELRKSQTEGVFDP